MSNHQTISAGSFSLVANQQGQIWSSDSHYFNYLSEVSVPFIASVSAGKTHGLALDQKGQVWSSGLHHQIDRLGLGPVDGVNVSNPNLIEGLPFIVEISAGGQHSLVLDHEGRVLSFGTNFSGQLGLGDQVNRNIPTLVIEVDSIVHISAGGDHSIVLNRDGGVWSFGSNGYGQLGVGSYVGHDNPILVRGLPFITEISAGQHHTLLLDQQGQVYSCGSNSHGQLGLELPSLRSPNNPARRPDDYVSRTIPTLIEGLPSIISISAGGMYSLILDREGYVWSFGDNGYGQLGLGDIVNRNKPTRIEDLPPIISVSAGEHHSLVMDREGQVWGFGYNYYEQLGLDNRQNQPVPVQIPHLMAQIPQTSSVISSPFVLTIYSLMKPFINPDFRINSQEGEDTIIEVDHNETIYLVKVKYDPEADLIDEPSVSDEDKYVNLFNELLQSNQLKSSAFVPEFYQDEKGNQALEFEDLRGRRYLILAHP